MHYICSDNLPAPILYIVLISLTISAVESTEFRQEQKARVAYCAIEYLVLICVWYVEAYIIYKTLCKYKPNKATY